MSNLRKSLLQSDSETPEPRTYTTKHGTAPSSVSTGKLPEYLVNAREKGYLIVGAFPRELKTTLAATLRRRENGLYTFGVQILVIRGMVKN